MACPGWSGAGLRSEMCGFMASHRRRTRPSSGRKSDDRGPSSESCGGRSSTSATLVLPAERLVVARSRGAWKQNIVQQVDRACFAKLLHVENLADFGAAYRARPQLAGAPHEDDAGCRRRK